MNRLLIGALAGIIAISFIGYAFANGNISICGFSGGCTGTNVTVTSTVTTTPGSGALIEFQFTQTTTVQASNPTATTTVTYHCPLIETTTDQYGMEVQC